MSSASVVIESEIVGSINQGLLVLVGVQQDDDEAIAEQFVERILNYRVFGDENDRMNRSLRDIEGGLLLVPQFTLAANTRKGRRPSFTWVATPERGKTIFHHMMDIARNNHSVVESGVFGADMQVQSINDGPVTFILD